MKKRILYQIDAFTKERFKGNPAGVVVNADGLNDKQMQLIATELNNSETAFLFSADSNDCEGIIRYFTPKTEVPTCGHATIAAMYAKALEDNLHSRTIRLKTRIGILPCRINKINGDYSVTMTQGKFEIHPVADKNTIAKLLKALGIDNSDRNHKCPLQIASTGHSKVMIGINNKAKLNTLSPNMTDLAKLSKHINCNGYFVFTFDSDNKDILTYGRMFAPAVGINEDPVTGNANGPLGGYLIHNNLADYRGNVFEFNAAQGEKMNRFGIIKVRVKITNNKPSLIQIQGDAVVIFKTTIEL